MDDSDHIVPTWQRAIVVLSSTTVGLVIVIALQWGRPVLIPIAVAVLLTFLLNPVVRTLQRHGLGRIFSVMMSVVAVGIILTGFGWIVARQMGRMVADLPHNTDRIKAKVRTLRELGSGPMADQFSQMIEEISQEIRHPSSEKNVADRESKNAEEAHPEKVAETGVVLQDSIPWISLTRYFGSALEVLATLAFSLVLLVFFLLGREDLRDRIVMLAGTARLIFTSKALEEITDRISRYIAMVAMVNGSFGLALTVGLYVLQVPYALLWGFLAAGLRFIPYIGSGIGAIFPILMSLATSEGWWQPLMVLAYIGTLELICGNVIEPYMFGRSIGVSPTALIISAAFWLYLWGPIGLILSAPVAVCLVVLGKNIPQLAFLNLLMGDAPALHAHLGIYQRFMLGDAHEAARLIMHQMKTSKSDEAYDEMLLPALNYTRRDVERNYLSDEDKRRVLEGIQKALILTKECRHSLIAVASPPTSSLTDDNSTPSRPDQPPSRIVACPVTDDVDAVALEVLRQLLDSKHWNLEIVPVGKSTADVVADIAANPPAIVCIGTVPPGGMTRARYFCRQLRDALPRVVIIVGQWNNGQDDAADRERLLQSGADFVTTTLQETRNTFESELRAKLSAPSSKAASENKAGNHCRRCPVRDATLKRCDGSFRLIAKRTSYP